MANTQARFSDLLRLKQHMDADAEIPLRELRRRDHHIGQSITTTDQMSRLLAWLARLDSVRASANEFHSTHLEGVLLYSLFGLGLVIGTGSMTGLLFANQQQPVNILLFLSVFVGLQILFVLITLVGACLPLSQSSAQLPLSFLNPATWAFTLIFKRSLRSYSLTMP